MKSAVENLSPTRVKLTVEVPSEELQPHVDAALKSIGSQIQVPGFRQGKVPARIIEQRVGKGAVIQEAVNEALPEFFGKAVDETEIDPIGQPEVDITEVPMTDEEIAEMITSADLDKDGFINEEEFLTQLDEAGAPQKSDASPSAS